MTPPPEAPLRHLIALFPEPEFQALRQYAELTLSGLPEEAMHALWAFIAEASEWAIRRRRQAAARIAEAAVSTGSGLGSDVLPDPLWNELVEPTLKAWAAEDDVALPHRYLVLLDRPSYELLSRAHVLDPEDQVVAHHLAAILIRNIDFSAATHGEIDLAKLEEAELVIATLQDDKAKQSLGASLDALRLRVADQVQTRGAGGRPPA